MMMSADMYIAVTIVTLVLHPVVRIAVVVVAVSAFREGIVGKRIDVDDLIQLPSFLALIAVALTGGVVFFELARKAFDWFTAIPLGVGGIAIGWTGFLFVAILISPMAQGMGQGCRILGMLALQRMKIQRLYR